MTFIPLIPSIYTNVKQYGARGDGSTDDTTAIQTAINAAVAGSVIFFPPGTYLISSTIQLIAELAYLGTIGSYGGSTIKQKNSSNLPAVIAAYEWYNNSTTCGNPIRIENLTIDANSSNNTTSHGIVCMNFDSIIRECTVINAPANGILFTSVNRSGSNISNSCVETRIESCKVSGAGTHCIYVQDNVGATTDGYIQSCIVSGATQDGIHLDRSSGWFLQSNHSYGCAMNAYWLNNCWSTFIIGNEVDGYGTSTTANYYSGIAVTLIGPRATVIEGNIINSGNETNDSSHYQHLNITGGGSTDTKAIVIGNSVFGGYVSTTSTTAVSSGTSTAVTPASMDNIFTGQHLTVGAENITVGTVTATTFAPASTWGSNHSGTYSIVSNKSAGNSIGQVYQTNSTQQSSGQNCTVISQGNRIESCGNTTYFDGIALIGPTQIDGTVAVTQSSTAVAIASNGTIATASIGVSRVAPTGNVTGIIVQAGTVAGQSVVVVNESSNTLTLNTTPATSNVADSATEPVIAALTARTYIWDSSTSRWYRSA